MAELETVEQGETNATENQEATERTFTQDEVNKMISARVNGMKRELADYEALKIKAEEFEGIDLEELKKAKTRAEEFEAKIKAMETENEIRLMKTAVSEKTGVPMNLLHGTDAEACEKEAAAILAFAKPKYPSVKDAGETKVTPKTKAEILAIKNEKERMRAIEENIELF